MWTLDTGIWPVDPLRSVGTTAMDATSAWAQIHSVFLYVAGFPSATPERKTSREEDPGVEILTAAISGAAVSGPLKVPAGNEAEELAFFS